MPELAQFLSDLIRVDGLAPSTAANYRTALNSVLQLSLGYNIAQDPTLSALLRGFATQAGPKQFLPEPAWSLSVVLDSLRYPPFEPKEQTTLENWSKKTLFLVALASGRRVSEIHALSFRDNQTVIYKDRMVLNTELGFRAKNQGIHERGNPIEIPSLRPLVGTHNTLEMALCPVRALFEYEKRTRTIRQGQKAMFVCFKKGENHKPASIATLARWIKQTVSFAYSKKHLDSETGAQIAKMHDLRGMGNTLAFTSGASIAHVLQAGFWKNSNTFISHYLKDLSAESEGLSRLGFIVAGQVVVSHRT